MPIVIDELYETNNSLIDKESFRCNINTVNFINKNWLIKILVSFYWFLITSDNDILSEVII